MSKAGYDCSSGITLQPHQSASSSLWLAAPRSRFVVHTDLNGDKLANGFQPGDLDAEDLAYDAVTFAPKCAVWANEGSDYSLPRITAFEVPCSPSPKELLAERPPTGTERNPPDPAGGFSRDPVHTLTGSYTYTHTDVSLPGRGPSPVFSRTYNSNDTRQSPLGWAGWTHNYHVRLRLPAEGSSDAVHVGPQGRSDLYTRQPDESLSPPAGVHNLLVKNADDVTVQLDGDPSGSDDVGL